MLAGNHEPTKREQSQAEKETVELQRLCYEIFHMTDMGRNLYEILLKKFILPSRVNPSDSYAANMALYAEGFKEALRGLHDHGLMHLKRINEGGQR